jgi:S-adenosylmethionine:tRNA ribosyltransferase-isomerase
VKSEEIEGHEMQTEHFAVRREVIRALIAANGQAVAVGTTSVRTLESLYHIGVALDETGDNEEALAVGQWQPYERPSEVSVTKALQNVDAYLERRRLDVLHAQTQIIIVPGYRFRVVKAMITNFHQPLSPLLLLVSAVVGTDWRAIYDYALAHDFRFLSYGDSSLLFPHA